MKNNKFNILFIEDELEFAQIIENYLSKRGFKISRTNSGEEGLVKLKEEEISLIILDLGLPGKSGLTICKEIRKKERIPILVLTAKDETEDKVKAFNLGADDYLVKPVSLKELLVRIRYLLKQDFSHGFSNSVFQFEEIKFDTINGNLERERKKIKLSKKEKAVLEYFLLNKGQVLTRMEIMDHIWGEEIDLFSNTLNMIVVSLRKKIAKLSKRGFIQSIYGLGYKFDF